eukprot:3486300-Prymnesium_polylepis.1
MIDGSLHVGYARVLELRKLNGKRRVPRLSVRAADASCCMAVVLPLTRQGIRPMGARPDQGAAGAGAAAQPRPSGDSNRGRWRTLGHLLVRLGSCASRWAGAAASTPAEAHYSGTWRGGCGF